MDKNIEYLFFNYNNQSKPTGSIAHVFGVLSLKHI